MTVGNEPRQPLDRLLDVALYAPVGILATLHDDLPAHVRRGRQRLENRVQLARFIGQLAVQQAKVQLSQRLEQQRAARVAAPVPDASAADDGPTSVVEVPSVPPVEAAVHPSSDRVPLHDELPIAGYQSLAAIHVVERLGTLRPDELDAVRRFEVANRRRRTILAKIDQLRDAAGTAS